MLTPASARLSVQKRGIWIEYSLFMLIEYEYEKTLMYFIRTLAKKRFIQVYF